MAAGTRTLWLVRPKFVQPIKKKWQQYEWWCRLYPNPKPEMTASGFWPNNRYFRALDEKGCEFLGLPTLERGGGPVPVTITVEPGDS